MRASSQPTGNWFAVTRTANLETATDTTIAQATTYKTFKTVMNAAGTSVEFFIDGVSRATHTTNIPNAVITPSIGVDIAGTAIDSGQIAIDYFYLKITGLSRADIAENYSVEDSSIEAGDLVRIKTDQSSSTEKYIIEKTSKPYDSQMIGAISTEPAMIFGEKGKDNLRPVALVGRVPVKVTTKNGAISAGDYLTSSNIPGVAMKATEPGMIIGKALESYSSASEEIGKIMVFVNPHWSLGSPNIEEGIFDQFTSAIKKVLEKLGLWFENGIAYMKALVVDALTIGSPEKPTGITIYDKITKEPYCWSSENGEIVKTKGKCTDVEIVTPPVETPPVTPEIQPAIETPTPEPSVPEVGSNPETSPPPTPDTTTPPVVIPPAENPPAPEIPTPTPTPTPAPQPETSQPSAETSAPAPVPEPTP